MGKIVYDMSNADYHSGNGYYSSTQLKTMLKSPQMFYNDYILGKKTMKDSPALRIGQAVHTKILEPEKYDQEIITYQGMRKGKKYEAFAKEHKDKIILSEKEQLQSDMACDNVFNNDCAAPYITGGQAEVSIFSELDGVPVKIRTDYINTKLGYIQDVKTFSELVNATNVKKAIAGWSYDLSAALYLDVAVKEGFDVDKFIWLFTSKVYRSSGVYKAHDNMIENGRIKYKKALSLIKYYEQSGWDFSDKVEEIEPIEYDLQNIQQTKSEDLW